MEKKLSFIIVIPARFASTRFPGKPLADIAGKSMIQRVYEQAQKSGVAERIVVATDDERIFSHVKSFSGEAVMTSKEHKSGTDRCYEALNKSGENFDVVINLQGDEPFIQPEQLQKLVSCFTDKNCNIATLAKKIQANTELENYNIVKVAMDENAYAINFSRNPKSFYKKNNLFRHIGLYAFRADTLKEITSLSSSPREVAESLEQLRWLENGYKIKVAETELESIAIDTPEDLERARSSC